MTLYFDLKNLGETPPRGALQVYATDLACGNEELLTEVDLADLALSPDWSTRCITLPDLAGHDAIGLAFTGGSHHIALDAVRGGVACHASPGAR